VCKLRQVTHPENHSSFTTELAALLTRKRTLFVEALLRNPGNAAAAARKAGYSTLRAKVTASELLRDPQVARALASGYQRRPRLRQAEAEVTVSPNASAFTPYPRNW
jgi:hypothetical protein